MNLPDIRLVQHRGAPSGVDLDRVTDWIVTFSAGAHEQRRRRFPWEGVLADRRRRLAGGKDDSKPLVTDLPNETGTRVVSALVEPGTSAFKLLGLARGLVAGVRTSAAEVGIAVHGFRGKEAERVAEAILAALYAAAAELPSYKQEKALRLAPARIELFGTAPAHRFRRTRVEAEGNALARHLSMLPSNILTPGDYRRRIQRIARAEGWRMEFHDVAALKRKKAGAFLAVVQGSPTADAGIVRLRYQPKAVRGRQKKKLVLVGKGICYDTGGTNLKPPKYMFGMHEDMQGSAVALGTLLALSRLNVKFPVEAWLALAMNHIGPKAYKPNDVITAVDGTTIEIVNTDAEGRMVLADTLVLAAKQKPALMIDYATLTGTCVYALDTAYSGVFTNRDEFIPGLVNAGRDSGERVWPFPMDEDYDKALESGIADIKQCAIEGSADHIRGARFLGRFAGETPWVHVDLSASSRKGGLAHIPSDTTGFGVRFTLNLLLDQGLAK